MFLIIESAPGRGGGGGGGFALSALHQDPGSSDEIQLGVVNLSIEGVWGGFYC